MATNFNAHPDTICSDENALALQIQARFNEGLTHHHAGQIAQAQEIYQRIIQLQPQHFDALHLLGVIAAQSGQHALAVDYMNQAIKVNSTNAQVFFNLGNALLALKENQGAVASYDQAIALKPDYAAAHYGLGNVLNTSNQHHAAVASYRKAINFKPDFALAHHNLGSSLVELNHYPLALASYDSALALDPRNAQFEANRRLASDKWKQHKNVLAKCGYRHNKPDANACLKLGTTAFEMGQYGVALHCFDEAIALQPNFAKTYYSRGNVLVALRQHLAAIDSYDQAIAIEPDFADAHFNVGSALIELKEYPSALNSLNQALVLNPDADFFDGVRLDVQLKICNWHNLPELLDALLQKIQQGKKVVGPFSLLSVCDSLVLQRQAAALYGHEKYPATPDLGPLSKRAHRDKLRIGYFSADFHNHATAYLIAELFEKHDKSQFELFAFSFGPDVKDSMRQRLSSAFDQFMDVRNHTDRAIAKLARNIGIDIAVDLKGFTQDSRPGIFSFRAAPVQVNYLGYPGTMAVSYMDYLIADRTLIPQDSQEHYSEKIVYLPNSYQVNDSQRKISDRVFTREELGLPRSGFVFCCFNNNYKILPSTFDSWMRILHAVQGSVLWLLEDSPTAANNLRKEACQRGEDPARLVFAKRMTIPDHLARHRAADLFLDTLPYNAHTTASDALWAGLPVLTCPGESFASRVAASLLHALDLPELVSTTHGAYEAMAIKLASYPEQLAAVNKKLAHHLSTTSLFNATTFARHIEAAFVQMHQRDQADLPPDHIHVAQ